MEQEYLINACSGEAIDVLKGQTIAVIDIEGGQVVDFFAELSDNPDEFLSTGVTIDCNESLRIKTGDYIYSNLYRPMLKVLSDDVEEHDLLHPCCRPEMYDFFYHNGKGHSNCLENINKNLKQARKIIHPINLFMYTKIDQNGNIEVNSPRSKAGDKIIFLAEMNIRLGIAACSVAESDCNSRNCTPIKIVIKDET